jgi:CheY-like chemotaxis protein
MPLSSVLFATGKAGSLSATRQHLAKLGIQNPLVPFHDATELILFLRELSIAKKSGIRLGVLLLDIDLPKFNGFETLRWLRSERALKDLPVVVLADDVDAKDVKRAAALGVQQIVSASSTHSALAEIIARIVSET